MSGPATLNDIERLLLDIRHLLVELVRAAGSVETDQERDARLLKLADEAEGAFDDQVAP